MHALSFLMHSYQTTPDSFHIPCSQLQRAHFFIYGMYNVFATHHSCFSGCRWFSLFNLVLLLCLLSEKGTGGRIKIKESNIGCRLYILLHETESKLHILSSTPKKKNQRATIAEIFLKNIQLLHRGSCFTGCDLIVLQGNSAKQGSI